MNNALCLTISVIAGLVGWVGLFAIDPVIAWFVFLIIWSNNLANRRSL